MWSCQDARHPSDLQSVVTAWPRWKFGCGRGRSAWGRPWWKRRSSLGNAKEVRHWCMSQQNMLGSYQCAMEFWRPGPQGSLVDGEQVELTLSLLFNRFSSRCWTALWCDCWMETAWEALQTSYSLMATEQQFSASWIEWVSMEDLIISRSPRALLASSQGCATSGGGLQL